VIDSCVAIAWVHPQVGTRRTRSSFSPVRFLTWNRQRSPSSGTRPSSISPRFMRPSTARPA